MHLLRVQVLEAAQVWGELLAVRITVSDTVASTTLTLTLTLTLRVHLLQPLSPQERHARPAEVDVRSHPHKILVLQLVGAVQVKALVIPRLLQVVTSKGSS